MPKQSLVSIICLCYNHERFVEEAIYSVLNQNYEALEIIIVDDLSTDSSRSVIDKICHVNPQIKKVYLDKNVGNTKAFNEGYKFSNGAYIIDFATDDVLLPDRVSKGVAALEESGIEHGVNFTNADIIDEEGKFLKHFYPINDKGEATKRPQDGDLFTSLIKEHFICSPTMLVRREVFESIHGYDDTLAYEDFDFWLRSSRNFKYLFTDQVLVKRRVVKGSMSSKQYRFNSHQMRSTFRVLEMAKGLARNKEERHALKSRIRLELRQCIKHFQVKLLLDYLKLLKSI